MLPVNTSPRQAAWWVMSHTLPTAVSGLLLVLLPTLGWVYLIPVLIVTLDLIWKNIRLIRQPTPSRAKKLFLSSNVYLLILLLAICIGATAASFGG